MVDIEQSKEIRHNGLDLVAGGDHGEYLVWESQYGEERMSMSKLSMGYDTFNHWEQDGGHLYWHGNYEVWEVYVGHYFPRGVGVQFVKYV